MADEAADVSEATEAGKAKANEANKVEANEADGAANKVNVVKEANVINEINAANEANIVKEAHVIDKIVGAIGADDTNKAIDAKEAEADKADDTRCGRQDQGQCCRRG